MNRTDYRSAIGVALAAACILVWLSLGVGIIGKDGDPANLMYFGVLAVGIIGAIVARFRPQGMARALFAMALAAAERVLRRDVCRIGLAVSARCASWRQGIRVNAVIAGETR